MGIYDINDNEIKIGHYYKLSPDVDVEQSVSYRNKTIYKLVRGRCRMTIYKYEKFISDRKPRKVTDVLNEYNCKTYIFFGDKKISLPTNKYLERVLSLKEMYDILSLK